MWYPKEGRMKYIVFGGKFVIVFPSLLDHDRMANGCLHTIHRSCVGDDDILDPTSAGYCYLSNGKWFAVGESVTLGLKPAEGDSDLINKWYEGI